MNRKFQSRLIEQILGSSITCAEEASRADARLFLDEITNVVKRQNWLSLVVMNYMGKDNSWTEQTLLKFLGYVRHDITLMKQRLVETATVTDVNTPADGGIA